MRLLQSVRFGKMCGMRSPKVRWGRGPAQRWARILRTAVASVVVSACFVTLAGSARADDDEDEEAANAEVLVNPLGLAFGMFNVEVGVGLTDDLSVNMSAAYWSLGVDDVNVTAYGGGAGVQYFLTGQLYDGWYVYPSVQFARATAKSQDLRAQATAIGVGALGGYQWDWRPFTLRLGAGVAYYSAKTTGDDVATGFTGVSPVLDASLGFTF